MFMRNSQAINAGVPAPFDSLEPLRVYLYLLSEVVARPNPESLAAYVAYDRDQFTPIANTSLSVGYGAGRLTSCILYDGVEVDAMLAQVPDKNSEEFDRVYNELFGRPTTLSSNPNEAGFPAPILESEPAVPTEQYRKWRGSEEALKNSARCVVNHLAGAVASSGAFPAHLVADAYQLLDDALVTFAGHDPKRLTFARKRMRMELLNVWSEQTRFRYRDCSFTGERKEVLRNVAIGWRLWGAPYGAGWIAHMVARLSPRGYF